MRIVPELRQRGRPTFFIGQGSAPQRLVLYQRWTVGHFRRPRWGRLVPWRRLEDAGTMVILQPSKFIQLLRQASSLSLSANQLRTSYISQLSNLWMPDSVSEAKVLALLCKQVHQVQSNNTLQPIHVSFKSAPFKRGLELALGIVKESWLTYSHFKWFSI